MDQIEKAAFIFNQSVSALCELQGMVSANQECRSRGEPLAYNEKAFYALQEKYLIGYNAVIGFLNK